jgi:outer membrane protein OmpA-like peptidoglycan-associated protein
MNYGTDHYDLFEDQPSGLARWVLPGLIISLLLHGLLFFWLRDLQFHPLASAATEPPPHTFKLQRIDLDPKVYEPQLEKKQQPAAVPHAVKLPRDKPSLAAMTAETKAVPAAPKIDRQLLAEKPKMEATSYERTVQDAESGGVKSVARELDQVRRDLLAEKPGVSSKSLLDIARPDVDSGASPAKRGELAGGTVPGFSNLDDLLAQTGPLSKETAPIRMDADVLYGFDSYQLQPQAMESLRKLGTIIQRNPQLVFSIEGHSDSFGSDDYNQQLSEYRAESVKAWLVQSMAVDPSRLSARGFGKTKLIVPATGDPTEENIEAERMNRRVEIVLHDRSNQPQ